MTPGAFQVEAANRASTGPIARCTAYALRPRFNSARVSKRRMPRSARKTVQSRATRA